MDAQPQPTARAVTQGVLLAWHLLSLAGRALAPLAVALTLLWSGTNAQPDMAGMPPRQPTMQATPQLPHGIFAGQMPLVRAAAGHGQRNRRDGTPAAALAAVLAGALAGVIRSVWGVGSRQPDRRRVALGPRAPPLPS